MTPLGTLLDSTDTNAPRPHATQRLLLGAIAALVVVGLAGLVAAVTLFIDRHGRFPADDSAAAGFARDMSTHHAQAVEMAEIIRARTDDPIIRFLGADISLTQQAQRGQMYGWLDVWGLPANTSRPAMEWMGMQVDGRMPGMASRDQINRLTKLQGLAADALFLTLMIEHHRAGVDMVEAVLDRTIPDEVRDFAAVMGAAQEAEIATMRDLLADIPDDSKQEPVVESDTQPGHGEGAHQ